LPRAAALRSRMKNAEAWLDAALQKLASSAAAAPPIPQRARLHVRSTVAATPFLQPAFAIGGPLPSP
jgi:hypothetical protein